MESEEMQPRERIILALDGLTPDQAVETAREFRGRVGIGKVGMELFFQEDGGHDVVRRVQDAGEFEIMLDLKIFDIPNTNRGAIRAVRKLKPKFLTVHAQGTKHVAACVDEAGSDIGILGVTVLTSMDQEEWEESAGAGTIAEAVFKRASCALRANAAGIVCSPKELGEFKYDASFGALKRIVPATRPTWASADDQKRVMTPREALAAKADYLVVGRTVLKPPQGMSRLDALDLLCAELQDLP